MKKIFCCDASREMYEDYYMHQGRGVPVFQGSRGQRGHGIGSVLSGLFRSALPMIKSGLATIGKQAIRTGTQILGDWADGQNIGEAAQKRFKQGIKEMVTSHNDPQQSGSGRRRIRRGAVFENKKKKKRKLIKHIDIFG